MEYILCRLIEICASRASKGGWLGLIAAHQQIRLRDLLTPLKGLKITCRLIVAGLKVRSGTAEFTNIMSDQLVGEIATRNLYDLETQRLRARLGGFRKLGRNLHWMRRSEDNLINNFLSGGKEAVPGLRDEIATRLLNFCGTVLLQYPKSVSTICERTYGVLLRRKLMLLELESLSRARLATLNNGVGNSTAAPEITTKLELVRLKRQGQSSLEGSLGALLEHDAFTGFDTHPALEFQRAMWGMTTSRVCHALSEDTLFIDYVLLRPFDLSGPIQDPPLHQHQRYVAFALSGSHKPPISFSDIGSQSEVDGVIEHCLGAIASGLSHSSNSLTVSATINRQSDPRIVLYRYLIKPFESLLAHHRRIIVSPDGLLGRLPFEVLLDPDGHALNDNYSVAYVGSARDLLRARKSDHRTADEPMIVGNPSFDLYLDNDGNSACSNETRAEPHFEDVAFTSLQGTQIEVEEISRILEVEPITGELATRRKVLAAQSPRILHIASHGFFVDPRYFREDRGALHKDQVADNELAFLAHSKNKLLHSGLVLAGANAWIRNSSVEIDQDNGLLFARDVIEMELSNTELVVLSACDTGLGDIRIGEGVIGLSSAFMMAGARAVIMSLWKVEDFATSELMKSFYGHLKSGRPPLDALRLARADVRVKHPKLCDWASFVLRVSGSFKEPVTGTPSAIIYGGNVIDISGYRSHAGH